MAAFLTLLRYFAMAFAGLAFIGFLVGANSDYSTFLDEIIVREMQVVKSGPNVYLMARCDGEPVAQYNLAEQSISSVLIEADPEHGILSPGKHKDVVIAVLGGGSAGVTLKYFAGLKNNRSALAGVIIGTISGYLVGNYYGEQFALRCGTRARQSKLLAKQNWQFYSRIKYAEKLNALGFSGIRVQSFANVATVFDETEPYISHWAPTIRTSLGSAKTDDASPREAASIVSLPIRKRLDPKLYFTPAILRCPSTLSNEIEFALRRSASDGFNPNGKDFLELQKLSSAFRKAARSASEEKFQMLWTAWVFNGLAKAEFDARGGFPALFAHGSKQVLELALQRRAGRPTFDGPAWDERRMALSELQRNSFVPKRLGPENDRVFEGLCKELLLEVDAA